MTFLFRTDVSPSICLFTVFIRHSSLSSVNCFSLVLHVRATYGVFGSIVRRVSTAEHTSLSDPARSEVLLFWCVISNLQFKTSCCKLCYTTMISTAVHQRRLKRFDSITKHLNSIIFDTTLTSTLCVRFKWVNHVASVISFTIHIGEMPHVSKSLSQYRTSDNYQFE